MKRGCAVVEGAFPIWKLFLRLSRGRSYSFSGQPLPLTFRDILDASQRCICELSAAAIEQTLTEVDDLFLELAENERAKRNNRRND